MPRKKAETVVETVPAAKTPPVRKKATKVKSKRDKVTRAQAMKLFCIQCCGYNRHFVKSCVIESCPIWPYRMGAGQQHTDVEIFQPKEWSKDVLVTEDSPEDDR